MKPGNTSDKLRWGSPGLAEAVAIYFLGPPSWLLAKERSRELLLSPHYQQMQVGEQLLFQYVYIYIDRCLPWEEATDRELSMQIRPQGGGRLPAGPMLIPASGCRVRDQVLFRLLVGGAGEEAIDRV